jgi:PKD repeat protein
MVSFNGSASFDNQGTINSYTWNFGDSPTNTMTAGPTTTHAYTASGPETITLTVSDGTHTGTTTRTITVDNPPSAAFTTTTVHPTATFPVSFDGSSSSEAGGSIASYSWDFGDGSPAGSGAAPSHTFATPGIKTVTLTVTDQDGHTAPITHQVTVGSAPVAQFSVPTSSPRAASAISFNGSGSTEPGGSIAAYSWNFGDGSPGGSGATPSHTYSSAGFYTVTLAVTDANGYTASVSHTLVVVAAPVSPAHGHPSAGFNVAPAKPVALARANFSGSSSTDIGSTLVSYAWNFGDRATASGITASHTYGRPGSYHVTLTVCDATGMSASSTRTVTVLSPGFTGVRIKTSHTVELIRLSLSGPGTVIVGRRHIRVKRASVTTYRLVLSRAQRAKLHSHHRLHIKIAVRFAPKVGATSRRTVAFTVKP